MRKEKNETLDQKHSTQINPNNKKQLLPKSHSTAGPYDTLLLLRLFGTYRQRQPRQQHLPAPTATRKNKLTVPPPTNQHTNDNTKIAHTGTATRSMLAFTAFHNTHLAPHPQDTTTPIHYYKRHIFTTTLRKCTVLPLGRPSIPPSQGKRKRQGKVR